MGWSGGHLAARLTASSEEGAVSRCYDNAKRPGVGGGGGSREEEGARCRAARTPEQGKVYQVAKRVLHCQEDAESLGRRRARKIPSDQEGVNREEGTEWPGGCCVASWPMQKERYP